MADYLYERSADAFWTTVKARSREALRSGALQPITTRVSFIKDQGVEFIVRVTDNLARKQSAPSAYHRSDDPDPFADPDPALTIGSAAPQHVAVLNKFNVIDHHVLVITREFVHQESPLTASDFAAVAPGLPGGAGLAFYNAGRTAGASQPHKHFQLVPLPLARGAGTPVASLFQGAASGVNTIQGLAFQHAFHRIDVDPSRPHAFGEACQHAYTESLRALELEPDPTFDDQRLPPYNLLLTDQWLCLVPRRIEHYREISVNGLGYAGSLFVSAPERLEQIKAAGPMTILNEVSIARR